MKELRLDIELAKSAKDYLNGTGISLDAINTKRDWTIGDISKQDSRVESSRNTKSEKGQDEMQDSPIGILPENREPGANIAATVTEGSILNDDAKLRGKVNSGFVLDPNESNIQTIKQRNLDTYTSFDIEGQHAVSITGAVTRSIDSAETCGNSRKKKITSCYDPIFRKKLLKTMFLLCNVTMLGWEYGQMGPTFPDLQDIAGVSLKQGSWLFTGFAIGYLSGCLLAGFTQTRFNSNLMLFVYTVVSAGAYTSTPWIPIFEVMVFLRGLSGVGIGGQDTCVHAMLFQTWGDKVGPYFQMLHVLFAVGGIVSPLVTKPFLRKYIQEIQLDIINSTHTVSLENATPSSVSTVSTNKNDTLTIDNSDDVTMTDTNVHYALIITGTLLVLTATPFIFMFFKDHHAKESKHQKNDEKVSSADKQKRLPTHIERIILCIFLLNSFVATAVLDLFPSFLTTFLIEQAGMTQQVGSNLTSAFFAMYAVGNFLNIFVSICIKTTKVILIAYISTVAMFTGVLLSVLYQNDELLSAFVSLSGVTAATIIPTIYTWIQENVTPITGTLASGLLISGSLGIALNPLLTGYLMDVYSPMWFIYLSIGNIFICAVLFIAAMLLTKIHSNKMNVTEETIRENERSAGGFKDNHIDIYVNGKLEKVYEITHL